MGTANIAACGDMLVIRQDQPQKKVFSFHVARVQIDQMQEFLNATFQILNIMSWIFINLCHLRSPWLSRFSAYSYLQTSCCVEEPLISVIGWEYLPNGMSSG